MSSKRPYEKPCLRKLGELKTVTLNSRANGNANQNA